MQNNKLIQEILAAEAQAEQIVKDAKEQAVLMVKEANREASQIVAQTEAKVKEQETALKGSVQTDDTVIAKYKQQYEQQAKDLLSASSNKYAPVAEFIAKEVQQKYS